MLSQTYIAVAVGFLSATLPKFGVEVGSEELTTTLSLVGTVVATVWALWGRYRAGGVSAFGLKKSN